MRPLLLTPRLVVTVARLTMLPCLATLAGAILVADTAPAPAAAAMFLTAIVLLQAAPKLRAADLLGLLALFATILEWMHAGLSGGIDASRWQAMIAVTGSMALLLKVQHLRSLAREDPYVPLRQLERRNVVLNRARPRAPGARRTA